MTLRFMNHWDEVVEIDTHLFSSHSFVLFRYIKKATPSETEPPGDITSEGFTGEPD